jgi:transcriptional regulator with XRE-family HTH domain
MLLKHLASTIRARRERRGLKQQDIANALNISPQAVSKWERGENAPDIAVLAPLARLLDVTIEEMLGPDVDNRDEFEATVFASTVRGAYRKSLEMHARDFAGWVNGFLFALTEATRQAGGVPVKYMGDGYLCFFSGAGHRTRALEMAYRARQVASEDLYAGLSSGPIYLGSVGHPDYARPDIMGEVVNIAFLTMRWAEANAGSGLAAGGAFTEALPRGVKTGRRDKAQFDGIGGPLPVCELLPSAQ